MEIRCDKVGVTVLSTPPRTVKHGEVMRNGHGHITTVLATRDDQEVVDITYWSHSRGKKKRRTRRWTATVRLRKRYLISSTDVPRQLD